MRSSTSSTALVTRTGLPDLVVSTFTSRLHDRDAARQYVNEDAYRNYLRDHPHDESRFFHPIENGPWHDDDELVTENAEVHVFHGCQLSVGVLH